jgi:hypothetical protein
MRSNIHNRLETNLLDRAHCLEKEQQTGFFQCEMLPANRRPLATLRSMVDAELFTDEELLQLSGLTLEGKDAHEASLAMHEQESQDV